MRHNHLVRRWGLPRGVFIAVCAIAAVLCLPAAASAAKGQVQVLKSCQGLPGSVDVQLPHGRDPDPPGAEHQRHRAHADVPARAANQRPGQRRRLQQGLEDEGLHHPVQAEHAGDSRRRLDDDAARLGSAPASRRLDRPERRAHLRFRRGEDDSQAAARLRLRGCGRCQLGDQPDDPRAQRPRGPLGLHHLGDRLGAAKRRRPKSRSSRPRCAGWTSPGCHTCTRSSMRRSATTSTRTASTSSPTTSRRTRRSPAIRSGRTSAGVPSGSCRRAARRSSSRPATCTPAACTPISRSPVMGPTRARRRVTRRGRRCPSSGRRRTTSNPRARSAGTSA